MSTRNIRPGCSRPLRTTRRRVEVEHADLAGQDDQAVVGDPVAPGPQAVAVEDGADQRAVGEGHAGRAVPGLHERRVELVERPPLGVHLGVVLPRLRDHHQHRVRQRAAAEVEQLEHLVEGRRVARARRADREQPLQVARDQVAGQLALAGPHPVAVALHGVDLAVVGDQPVGVGQRPGREGVGREPRVDQGQLGLVRAVGQVREERLQLAGGEHALVDQRARRQRREVERRPRARPACAGRRPAGPARSRCAGSPVAASATNSCRNDGMQSRAACPTRSSADRHVAPAEHRAGPPRRRCASTRATASARSPASTGRKASPTA